MAKLSPSRNSTVVDVSRRGEGINLEAIEGDAVGRVDRRDRGLEFKVDQIAVNDTRNEVELDTEGFEFNRDRIVLPGQPGPDIRRQPETWLPDLTGR